MTEQHEFVLVVQYPCSGRHDVGLDERIGDHLNGTLIGAEIDANERRLLFSYETRSDLNHDGARCFGFPERHTRGVLFSYRINTAREDSDD